MMHLTNGMHRDLSATYRRVMQSISVFTLWLMAVCLMSLVPVFALNLAPVVDEYRLTAKDWQITEHADAPAEDRYLLQVSESGKNYSWPMRPDFIAQSLRGNDVSDEIAEEVAVSHIRGLSKQQGMLMFKLASFTTGGRLFVRSAKIFNFDEAYATAEKFGSPVLNIGSDEVQRMGANKYRKEIERTIKDEWKKFSTRPQP